MCDTRYITSESDAHGEICSWCMERACNTNVYYVDANGDDDIDYACGECVPVVIEHRHTGDRRDPIVEISTAPLPALAAACR